MTKCLGFIPARGGSKSIPLKNLARFLGRPLLDWAITAGAVCDDLVVSTDHPDISARARLRGARVDVRPESLCGDDVKIVDVLAEYFARNEVDICVLLQPTSPLVRREDIRAVVEALGFDYGQKNSAQTVIECPHNAHGWNQREILGGKVDFVVPDRSSNKQDKPKRYLFGNVVAFRPKALLAQREVFAVPSVPIVIPREFALDIDFSGCQAAAFGKTLQGSCLLVGSDGEAAAVYRECSEQGQAGKWLYSGEP